MHSSPTRRDADRPQQEGQMTRRLRAVLDGLISLAIFSGAWAIRAISSCAFVTWDEPAWVYRSVKFLLALSRGDWASTALVGHPGVVTMWTGALSLAWHRLVSGTVTQAQLAAVDMLPALEVHDPDTIRRLAALLPAAKAGSLIVHAAIAVALFWLLKRPLSRPYALAGVLFLTLDPYYLALSRVLHIDALASGFMLIAIVSSLIRARGGGRAYLLYSGLAAGLAALTKSYSVLVAPLVVSFLALSWAWGVLGRDHEGQHLAFRQRLVYFACDVALWGGVALSIFAVAWPAMWVSPVDVLRSMVGLSLEYAITPGDATASFFRGQVTTLLGPSFYLVTMFFRTTPLTLVGAFLGLAGLLLCGGEEDSADEARRPVTLGLVVYASLYIAVVTLSRKKFDRYTLPALLGLDVVAALGVVGGLDFIGRVAGLRGGSYSTVRRVIAPVITLLLVFLQSYVLLRPLYPAHYLAYYNPLAGGPRKAAQAIPLGWGEGIERAAQYLAAKPHAEEITVATWAIAGVAPIFPGRLVTLAEETIPEADYVLLYLGDVQAQAPLAKRFHQAEDPEFVVVLNGIEYAWLYPNVYYVQLSREIAEVADSNDVIILNTPSAFERRYRGDLSWHVVEGVTEGQVAGELRAAAQRANHIFYLEYQNGDPRREFIRRQLAQNALFLWQRPFAYGTMSYYQLAQNASFRHVLAPLGVGVDFGHQLLLESYGLSDDQVEYRQELGLGLQWRALRQMAKDYHVFLHLVDDEGRMWGQRDQPLRDDGFARTSAWREQTPRLCNYSLPLDAGIPPGPYWVTVGVYDLADMSLLDIIDEDERKHGTEFRIGPVQVVTPTVPPAIEDLPIQHRVDLRLGSKAQILGYALSSESPRSGDEVMVTLFWRCLGKMDLRYDLGLRLQRDGSTVGFKRVDPAGPHHLTDKWVPGEIFRYPQSLPIAADAAGGTYRVYLNLYATGSDETLAPQDVLLTQIETRSRERLFAVPEIQFPIVVNLDDQIEFLGYDLAEITVEPGGTLHLSLYWRALRPMDTAYTVFTHLLDDQDIIRGQRDSVPVKGERPTTGWAAGEVVIDPYEIPIHGDAKPGPHLIEIGVYDQNTGERLSMTRADGSPIHERRILFEQIITVQR